ncbi:MULTISPECIES: carbohydrate ABC transporter permease [Microbacterium]|jgi:raffinose/stachyose/melibiose transport system permease protein|uniref:carbohydrate ABC transporter permease n=1 Tax=Microbacterium TaxID=33882 RepID=UPI001CBEF643|nr:sugar ABC transporter permease [Microbacterium sp. OVT16B]
MTTSLSPRREGSGLAAGPSRRPRRGWSSLLYLLPAFVFYGTFTIAPWVQSIWLSFWNWDGIGAATWAGIENYLRVFTDDRLLVALRNGLGFIVFYTAFPLVLGLVIAAVIAARPRRGSGFVRTVLFLPQILPLVAVGVVWRYLYAADGPINQFLTAIGLGDVARAWLGDFTWAYPAVGIIGTWVTTGLCMMLLLAGIQKIDPSLYEAARLDRCGPIRQFWHVTVPGVRAEIVVAVTVTLISALASFDIVYVTTGGGPGDQTIVPGVLIYKLVFTSNEVGLACALATVLSAIILVFVAVIGRVGRRSA